jgi:hypothetical protein
MVRYRFRGLFFLLFLAFNPTSLTAKSLIRVDEGRTRLLPAGNKSVLRMAVASGLTREIPVRIDLDVLGTDDEVIETVSREFTFSQRTREVDVPLNASFSRFVRSYDTDPIWHRLRYRLTEGDSTRRDTVAYGLISVSQLGVEPFVLRVAPPMRVIGGTRSRIHVFTQQPGSGGPVRHVRMQGTLTISEGTSAHVLKAMALTNSSGYAALNFDIPDKLQDPDLTFKVTATLGTFVRQIEDDLDFDRRAQIVLSTDKPTYQPGQHLRIRVLALKRAERALDKATLELAIRDNRSVTIHRASLTTSAFGEADAEWVIPGNAGPGDYVIEARLGDRSGSASTSVKISRSDLPAFAISVKAERTYHLPGQNAQLEIRADYLLDQPVKYGQVRVIREHTPVIEGKLDAQGHFIAAIDLQEEHDRLASQDEQRYADLQYAVYVTDAATNRTEQRRFGLRVSKEPIHIYVSESNNARGLPLEFYLSTFYADGTPAPSRVSIYASPDAAFQANQQTPGRGGRLLRVIHTNRYGLAKVTELKSDSPVLRFKAEDEKGKRGQRSEEIGLRDSALRVYTKKNLYRSGELLPVEVHSTFLTGPVVLELVREARILHSQVVQLKNGKAYALIPYADGFKDDVTIVGYYGGSGDRNRSFGTRTVAYPRDRELKIDARTGRSSADGDEVSIAFRVRSAEGMAKPGLLGVVVIDTAIEERGRADVEFDRAHSLCDACAGWFGYDRNVSGVTRRDLDKLDLSHPVPDDLDLAAEVLLNSGSDIAMRPEFIDDEAIPPRDIFKNLIEQRLAPLKQALEASVSLNGSHPTDEASLRTVLSISGLSAEDFHDPWGCSYRPSFAVDRGIYIMELQSSGPDKRFGSLDDFSALRSTWRLAGDGTLIVELIGTEDDTSLDRSHQPDRPAWTTPGQPMSIPTLREYLADTLFWAPAIETNRAGRARIKFKLPSRITTWKLAAVVSTGDGRIGMVEMGPVSLPAR